MRKLLVFLLLIGSYFGVRAQVVSYPDLEATKHLQPPRTATLSALNALSIKPGVALVYSTSDSGFYYRLTLAGPWTKVCTSCGGGGGSIDTTNISNRLDTLGGKRYVDSLTYTDTTIIWWKDGIASPIPVVTTPPNVYTFYVRSGTNTDTLFYTDNSVEHVYYVVDIVNGLLSGGEVTPTLNPYCKNVATVNFRINKVRYSVPGVDSLCLAACDSLPRIDVFYADTLGNIGVLTGIPDSVPTKPQVDESYQIELSFAQIQCDTSGVNFQFPNNVYYGIGNIPYGSKYFTYDSSTGARTLRVGLDFLAINNTPSIVRAKFDGNAWTSGNWINAGNGFTGLLWETFGWQRRQLININNQKSINLTGDLGSGTTMNSGDNLNFFGVYDSASTRPYVFTGPLLNQYIASFNSPRRAVLFPRMNTTVQNKMSYNYRDAFGNANTLQDGMLMFNTDSLGFVYSSGGAWHKFGSGTSNGITDISYRPGTVIDTLYYTNASGETNWYYLVAKDGLLAGGDVTYAGFERTYHISAAYIRKAGVFYSTSDTTIILPALSDPDSSRTDVFIANISGQNTSIQGVESANPLVPQINTDTDVYLTNVTITPTNQAGVDTAVIYDQNVEWTGSATGVAVNFGGTTTPYRGSKAADVGAINNNDVIEWTNGSLINKDSYTGISGFWKLKAVMPANNYVYLSFWNGTTQVSNEVLWPINKSNITSYQGLSLSMSAFTWTNNFFNKVRYRYSGGGAGISGWYSDFIYLQNGIAPPVYFTGITSLNGLTAAVQTFSNGSSGLAPNWSSAIANHTLNIPLASGSGVTSGTISKTEYDIFNAKEPAVTAPYVAKYYYNAYKQFVALNTDSIGVEGATNLWFTNARARAAVDLLFSTGGTSGPATGTYNQATGLFTINVPQYQSALSFPNTVNKYLNGYGNFPTLNTDSITEGSTNLFFTQARARAAVSLNFTTTGTSGAATGTYSAATGIFTINVPNYSSGATGWFTTGNTGTTTSNYLGTTDQTASLRLATNATTRFWIDSAARIMWTGPNLIRYPSGGNFVSTDSAAGFRISNGLASTTSFEEGGMYWSSNVFTLSSSVLSAGVGKGARSLQLRGATSAGALTTMTMGDAMNFVHPGNAGGANTQVYSFSAGTAANSTPSIWKDHALIFGGMSGTGNMSALRVSELSTVTGFVQLLNLGTNSASTGAIGTHSPKFTVDMNGSVAMGANYPIPGAAVDINSTTRALIPPRMTQTNRDAILLNGVQTATLTAGGTGYGAFTQLNLTFTGGTGTGLNVSAAASSGGVVTTFTIINYGSGYTVGDVLTASGGTGSGFQITVASLTNSGGAEIFSTTQGAINNYNGTNWTGFNTSSAASLTLKHGNNYVFTGTTSTFTLPAPSSVLLGVQNGIVIKNRGSGNITLSSASGSQIYTTSAQASVTIAAGGAIQLMPDGTYFNVISTY